MLFVIIALLVGAFIYGRQAYIAHNSGTLIPIKDKDGYSTGKFIKSDKKFPYYKIGQFWFAVAFVVATIVIAIVMHLEK